MNASNRNPSVAKISDTVNTISPQDALEKQHISDTLDWLKDTDDIFRRQKPDIPRKHLVSYFVLYDPARKSILLCDHILAQLWLPSGGHVEVDEDPADTVRRESKEELGITAIFLNNSLPLFLTVTETVGITAGHTDVSLWYIIKGDSIDHINFDRREFNDIEWWTLDEILSTNPTIFDPHMHRFTKKLIAQLNN